MKYPLLDTRNDKHYLGDTLAQALHASGAAVIDSDAFTVLVKGRDRLAYTKSNYTLREFYAISAEDAVRKLCRDYAYTLYRSAE